MAQLHPYYQRPSVAHSDKTASVCCAVFVVLVLLALVLGRFA